MQPSKDGECVNCRHKIESDYMFCSKECASRLAAIVASINGIDVAVEAIRATMMACPEGMWPGELEERKQYQASRTENQSTDDPQLPDFPRPMGVTPPKHITPSKATWFNGVDDLLSSI